MGENTRMHTDTGSRWSCFTEEDLRKFGSGTFYESYEKFGAHMVTADGVSGVNFAVWAPEAKGVGVAGDFNGWNGERHPMNRLGDSGVYELFIPELGAGMKYKYEVITSGGAKMLKADPYAFQAELRPATASVICARGGYEWHDESWMRSRPQMQAKDRPMSVYEVHLGSWMQKPVAKDADGNDINGSQFYGYKELAMRLARHVQDLGYTHVDLLPVMEHPLDKSWGYQVTGYYAPTSRYGTPDEFRWFVDYLHREGIGVILDWAPAQFPKDAHGLASFDGTCLYEHLDPKQGENPSWGTLLYNYGRPQVSNFLLSNALYWAKEFHIDGLCLSAVDQMLYLDYGKNAGQWVSNIYGGRENLQAVEFLKHLNSIFHREVPGGLTIAEESAIWPRMTGELREDGLGFDYQWNMGWKNDFLRYMQCDPQDRSRNYGDLTASMLYAYSEKYMQILSHDEVTNGRGSLYSRMPGDTPEKKMANLRAAYGFMMGHPGRKLLFMGQEFAQKREWSEAENLEWECLDVPLHAKLRDYVREWNLLYRSQPALYAQDFEPEGFEWINCTSPKDCLIAFARRTRNEEDTLVFVYNFLPSAHREYRLGVPFDGDYEEILNSDAVRFGGGGMENPLCIHAEPIERDGRGQSIVIDVPPMGVCVFQRVRPQWPTGADGVAEESAGGPDGRGTGDGHGYRGARTDRKELAQTLAKLGKTGLRVKNEVAGKVHHAARHAHGRVIETAAIPAQTAKAAKDAIAQRGSDAIDRISDRLDQIRNRKQAADTDKKSE